MISELNLTRKHYSSLASRFSHYHITALTNSQFSFLHSQFSWHSLSHHFLITFSFQSNYAKQKLSKMGERALFYWKSVSKGRGFLLYLRARFKELYVNKQKRTITLPRAGQMLLQFWKTIYFWRLTWSLRGSIIKWQSQYQRFREKTLSLPFITTYQQRLKF